MSTSDEMPSTELAITGANAVDMKNSAATVRAELTRSIQTVKGARADLTAELNRRRAELEAEFARQSAELEAKLKPLEEQVEKLKEVMWTVDLYLGRDESLRLVQDGRPAPDDTPITIRQRVLVMSEESLVLMDGAQTGMSHRDIDSFADWLCASHDNLNRILPEQKGVVVLVPTRVQSNTGDPFYDIAEDEENQTSWWLLRNGERLHLLTTDIRVGDRLLPNRREFVEVFDQKIFGRTSRLEPGSKQWLDLEKKADRRRRHYMRIMLILQGLLDRTTVWRPLPPAGINLLTVEAQNSGKVQLIQDADTSVQLGTGRPDFATWQRSLNERMRPGVRVVGDWNSSAFRRLRDHNDPGHPRLWPETVGEVPEAGVPHLLEGRRGEGFVLRFVRSTKVWRRNTPVPGRPGYIYKGEQPVTATKRASCIVTPNDTWVLAYDLASLDELRYYLGSREDRSAHFLSMVPTLRSAIKAKEDEAAAEAPFRQLLTGQLIAAGADPEGADPLVDDLVHWWKLANTWTRPLNGEPEHEARAVKQILAEYRSRSRATDEATLQRIVASGRTIPGAICIARDRSGRWHAYAPARGSRTWPEPGNQIFLNETRIKADGTLGETSTWRKLPSRSASLLQVVWSTPEWDTWNFAANANHYLTAPERDELINAILADATGIPLCITEQHDPSDPATRTLRLHSWSAPEPPEQATPIPEGDPFSWRINPEDQVLTVRRWSIAKNGKRITREPARAGHGDNDWGRYSVDRHGRSERLFSADSDRKYAEHAWEVGIPWWPRSTGNEDRFPSRPHLVWSDDAAIDRINTYRRRCMELAASQREREEKDRRERTGYIDAIMRAAREIREARLKDRFLQDYGLDGLDLWPSHLESLRLNQNPLDYRNLASMVGAAHSARHPIEGLPLQELRDWWINREDGTTPDAPAWRSDRRQIDISGYEDLLIPPSPSADTSGDDESAP